MTSRKLDESVAAYRKAIDLRPDYAEAYNTLGAALRGQKKLNEAAAAFRKAIDANPDYAEAYYNLGIVLRDQKKPEEAVAAYRKAIYLKPDYAEAYTNLGNALCDQKKVDEAVAAYHKAIDLKPDTAEAHYSLGIALYDQKKLDEAAAAYRKAIELKGNYANAYFNLGTVLRSQNKMDEAAAAYGKALELKPDDAEASCNLGQVLCDAGKFHEALDYLKRGHRLGQNTAGWPHPSHLWIKQCEQLIELDDKLVAIMKGDQKPKNAEEQLAIADLSARYKKNYVSAIRFFRNAFAEDPKLAIDINKGHRYNAACSAALAGTGQGKDNAKPDEKERAWLRQQALDWLRADLAAWSIMLDTDQPMIRETILQQLNHWKEDIDLAGIRDQDSLAKLPEAEQEALRKFWADVDQLLKTAKEAKK